MIGLLDRAAGGRCGEGKVRGTVIGRLASRTRWGARPPLNQSVVVVTGASGGIGRAAAEAFAARGATVVLAARRETALQEVRTRCIERGGNALVVPTDVSEANQVAALADRAVDAFGRIDIWVNNAAVTAFGTFEQSPLSAFERVIQTNLMGYVYGAHAVLPYLRRQGFGVLINVGSVVSGLGTPFTSAYVVSKWAIRGLSECLRAELQDAPGIHVCTVMPGSTDTPLFQQGANYTGRAMQAMKPIHPPEAVAAAIVRAAGRRRREVVVGLSGRVAMLGYLLAPNLFSRLIAREVARRHFQDRAAPVGDGNLFKASLGPSKIDGGWQEFHRRNDATAPALRTLSEPNAAWPRRRRRLPAE